MNPKKPIFKRLGCLPITFIIVSIVLIAYRELKVIFLSAFGGRSATLPEMNTINLAALGLMIYAFIFLVFIFLSISFLSQFVIPVKNYDDRLKAFRLIGQYALNWTGLIVRIVNGEEFMESAEKTAARPGIILVDFNSAVLLGEDKVIGPGLTFRAQGEKVHKPVDLRRQNCSRPGIQGNTQDGIKIKTSISVRFTLSEEPELVFVTSTGQGDIQLINFDYKSLPSGKVKYIKGFLDALSDGDKKDISRFVKSYHRSQVEHPRPSLGHQNASPGRSYCSAFFLPFSIDPKRVIAAVKSRLKDEEHGRFTDWKDYPAYFATAIFRDLLIHEKFDDLCLPEDLETNPLDELRTHFSKKVECQGLIAVQYVARVDRSPLEKDQIWQESELIFYPPWLLKQSTILRERGIKVVGASFSELTPVDEDVREQVFKSWQANWLREEKEIQADNDLKAIRIRNRARVQAQSDMVYALSQILRTTPDSKGDLSTEALAMRVFQALETTATDPVTRKLLSKEAIRLLGDLRQWLLSESSNDEPDNIKPYNNETGNEKA